MNLSKYVNVNRNMYNENAGNLQIIQKLHKWSNVLAQIIYMIIINTTWGLIYMIIIYIIIGLEN